MCDLIHLFWSEVIHLVHGFSQGDRSDRGDAREQNVMHFEEFIAKIPSKVDHEKQTF